jgi:TRAP-type C4-dicarboxylate transport system permease large subunit
VVLFVTSRIANIGFEKMSRAILSWLIPLLTVLLMITIRPPLTLWLPGLLTGR